MFNSPLVSSSVHDNDDILQYTTDPLTIFERYEHEVDAVIDCGYGKNVASTIVDCTSDNPAILRQELVLLNKSNYHHVNMDNLLTISLL